MTTRIKIDYMNKSLQIFVKSFGENTGLFKEDEIGGCDILG